jgi:general secretion pathway protein B
MSFILEALKKSENERQRTVGPSLADVPMRPPREEKPWWAIALGILLLANLLVLLVVLIRGGLRETPPAPQPVSTAAPAPQPAPAPTIQSAPVATPPAQTATPALARPERLRSSPAVRSLADEAASATVDADPYETEQPPPQLAAAARVPEGPSIVRPLEQNHRTGAFVSPRPAPAAEPREALPTLQDLLASGAQLPDLHVDIHVHSPVPAQRFVFVNMRKYVEGETLAEGPLVERITSDGVVLNHRGTRFLLPRP